VKKGKQLQVISSWFAMLSPDGQTVLTTQWPNKVILWDSQTGRRKLAIVERANLYLDFATFDPTGSLILTYELDDQPTLQTWDAKTGKQLQSFKGHTSYIKDACFSPDGQMIVSASLDKTVRFWNTKNGKQLKQLKLKGALHSILIGGDGKRLYATWDDSFGNLNEHGILWDIDTGKEILELKKMILPDSVPMAVAS